MRTVFTNHMVAHVWAQQNQSHGRSGNGHFYFRNRTIYSYRDSYPIGHFTGVVHDGKQVVLFQEDRYSVSTAQHINMAKRAVHHALCFDVPYPTLDSGMESHRQNLEWMKARWVTACEGMRNPVKHVWGLDDLPGDDEEARRLHACANNEWIDKAEQYAQAFGLPSSIPNWDILNQQAQIMERFAKYNDPKRAKARERSAARKGIALQSIIARCLAHKEGCAPPVPYTLLAKVPKHIRGQLDLPRYISNYDVRHGVWDANTQWEPYVQERLTIDEWWNGKGHTTASMIVGTHSPRYDRPAYTLVRRKGDTVETSQGASVPFEAAVRLYQFAQKYKMGRYKECYMAPPLSDMRERIGHFTLDKIEANGDCKVGCHHLNFAEMTRLAIKEVPHLVRPAYPLPVVIA